MVRQMANAFLIASLLVLSGGASAGKADLNDEMVGKLSRDVLFGTFVVGAEALDQLVARGRPDVVPSLILALRYSPIDANLSDAISKLAGVPIDGWRDAMLWQEAHPQIIPHPSYRDLKLEVFKRIDPQFMRFLGGELSKRENLNIRLEEVVWGGVRVDGIPALNSPKLIKASDADYLRPSDLVFGVEINGDVRAYPLRIMGWHEMFNDTIGGVPVALAYCTLCGAGILFETKLPGRDKPFIFGSSGFLYRSNKLMFDRGTDSLWNQFTGKPVSGPLRNTGIELKIRPVVITAWSKWRARHPSTKVPSLKTGHQRDYGPGVVYNEYFASPELMFPAIVRDEKTIKRKDFIFGIRDVGTAKAWPLTAFITRAVINDAIGPRNIVLIGDAVTRTVRAYNRSGLEFIAGESPQHLKGPNGNWLITEDALIGPGGAKLARVPGHISYWFAWDGYLGVKSAVYKAVP